MSSARSAFRFAERLRVRWVEIDAQQIVFNGHYLMYLDTAMGGYWRALALPYAASMEQLGGDLYVRKATLEYHASARYDDLLSIALRCVRVGRSSIVIEGTVFREAQALVGSELVYVFADPRTQTSRPVPDALRTILLDFEAGAAMLDVRIGSWEALGADAGSLRRQVFVTEQGLAPAFAHDAADAACLHAVAYNRLGRPLAAARLLQPAAGESAIGRLAVIVPLREGGIGMAVVDALVACARTRGDRRVVAQALAGAVGFWQRAGFVACGSSFLAAGVEHIEMEFRLS